ncbi:hypothetical protein J1N35_044437, partial [Gossypium stocksii]
MKCFVCDGLHMVRCLKKSVLSTVEGDNEPNRAYTRLGLVMHFDEAKRVIENEKKLLSAITKEDEVELVESEALKFGSLILNYTKGHYTCSYQRNLSKLGLSISKVNKSIKI